MTCRVTDEKFGPPGQVSFKSHENFQLTKLRTNVGHKVDHSTASTQGAANWSEPTTLCSWVRVQVAFRRQSFSKAFISALGGKLIVWLTKSI